MIDDDSARQPTHHTIHENYLVSLIDGQHCVMLKRHIHQHGYTAQSYREAFGLPDDYPMVPPAYSRRRSALSKQIDHSNRWDPNTNMPLSERRRAAGQHVAQPTRSEPLGRGSSRRS
jgi:predicted transcriptional regulator